MTGTSKSTILAILALCLVALGILATVLAVPTKNIDLAYVAIGCFFLSGHSVPIEALDFSYAKN